MERLDGNALLDRLSSHLQGVRGRLTPMAPMAKVTWFRVGGPAELMFQPADRDDLSHFLKNLPEEIPVMVVGIGSNLLVRDGGVPGIVIRLSAKGFGAAEISGERRIEAGAACPDKRLAAAALDAELGGFAFYHGIPGGVGGALRMNAGANGTETCQRVVEVHGLDRQGREHTFTLEEMGYGYRHSSVPADIIFTHAVFEGLASDTETIKAEMAAVQHHRETVQPIREKTGGSTFKNPEGISAWKAIDKAGGRGLTIGGAQMSPMHCNFMINTGSATAHDLETLGETVRTRVMENSGIRLEWEIKRIGIFREEAIVQPFLGRML